MNCSNCNAWLPDDAAFCSECGQKVEAAAPSAPTASFCPNCGAELKGGDAFCGMCGARVESAGENIPPRKKEMPKIKIPVKGLLTCAAAAAVIVLLVVIASSLFGGSKTSNYAVYIKDGELQYAEMPRGKNAVELTSKLLDGDYTDEDTQSQLYLSNYLKMSDDGKRLFFPDKIDASEYGTVYEYTLYYRNVNSKKEAVKIDSGLNGSYSINASGTVVTYLKDGNLYQHDLSEKTKIDSDVADYRVSEDGKTLVYLIREDEDSSDLYRKKGNKDAEKLVSDVTAIEYVSDDAATILYYKEDALYIMKGGKDAEKISSDVAYAITYESGEVYYVKYKDESTLWDFIDNDMDSDDYGYFRDSLQEEADTLWSELYYFDGKESVLLSEYMVDDYWDCAYDEPAFAYIVWNGDEVSPIKFSEYMEDSYAATEDFTKELMENYSVCVATKGTVAELDLEAEDISGLSISNDGKVLYVSTEYDSDDATVTLYKVELSGGKVKSSELFDEDVYTYYRFADEHSILYYKDINEDYEGELYLDGTMIAEDVYLWYCQYNEETGNLYYMVDWDSEDSRGTLTYFDGKKSVTVKEDVYNYYATVEGEVLFLYDYNTSRRKGELWIQDGKNITKLDDDVVSVFIGR